MYKNKSVGVVVPAYNEEKLISSVLNGIPDYVDSIFIIDDASKDKTVEVALSLAESKNRTEVVRQKRNGGVGKAIVSGYACCLVNNIDIAVVMAGDNQMDPMQLPRLLDPIVEGKADYAVGDRLSNLKHMKGMSYWRRFGNWLLKWLTRIAAGNMKINDPQNGYTAITRQALKQLNLDSIYHRYGYCNDILVKLSVAKARIIHIPMPAVYNSEKSKIRYWRYIPRVSWLLLINFIWRIKGVILGN